MVEIVLTLAVLAVSVKPLGTYMAHVYGGQRVLLSPMLEKIERLMYRAGGIDPASGMRWTGYAAGVLTLSFIGWLALFAILLLQHALPLNPQGFAGLAPDAAFNIAVSFVTNTNWQSYSGERTLSYFSQAAGLAVQQFIASATGMSVAVALFRAFALKKSETLGNFWADTVRGMLYILLPFSLTLALLLASQGVVQNVASYAEYTPLQSEADAPEKKQIALGPVASQAAIKMLGTNGGGFFNANAAHPFENPTPFSNFLQMIAILLIPASMVYLFGVMVGDRRQGWAILAAMTIIFIPLLWLAVQQEMAANPLLAPYDIDQSAGNMEGKEQRFGVAVSAFWASAATATSSGAVNSMHSSFSALGGLVPLLLMQFGEVVYGGVGSGMIAALTFVVITVFIAGLMVGRTPEFLGKKLGPYEIKMACLIFLTPAALVLIGSSLAMISDAGSASPLNPGAHGFSEIIYALTSAAYNNGSAFAGLSVNNPFYNTLLGVVMFLGRFMVITAALALAGAVAAKFSVPPSAGTLPTHTPLFIWMLIVVILIVGVLTFVPALALGPVAEHLLRLAEMS